MFTLVTTQEEIEAVSHKAHAIWIEHFIPIIGIAQVEYMFALFLSANAIQQAIQDGYQFYQIVKDDHLIGFFSIKREESSLFISKLYIEKTQRGHGYARAAMSFIENYAKIHHYTYIWLTCNKENVKTISIYQKMGFTIFDSVVNEIGHGYVMDDYYLRKTI